MKRLFLSLSFVGIFSTSLFANSAAEEKSQSAVMASGKSVGYAIEYCRNTQHSASKWAYVIKYTSYGQSISYPDFLIWTYTF